jgi:predicted lipoprotein with Yx(FWY)xxD motif
MVKGRTHTLRLVAAPVLALAVALVVAACGGSSSSNSASTGSSAGGTTTSASVASASASSGTAKETALTIGSTSGSTGTYLVGASGRAVYLWLGDKSGMSNCTGSCASAWPPVTTKTSPSAGSGVTASDLGTISRAGGVKQVTYNGHPLYYFAGDSGSGTTSGQGSDGFGAKWWLVAPSGSAITGSGSAAASSSATSSGGSSTSGGSSSGSSTSSAAGGGWS